MNDREMKEFVEAAVRAAGTRDAVAVLTESREASVRFGQNRITQNLDVFRRELKLTVGDGERKATLTSQRIDMDALPAIAGEARSLLATASPDPEYMPSVPGGAVYPVIHGAWDEYTAECPASPRMDAVGKVIDRAEADGYQAAGICGMSSEQTAVSTSTGNTGFHRQTSSALSFTMDQGRASSYTSLSGTGWNEIAVEDAVNEVASRVAMNMDQKEVPPGEYKLILEPEATWNLMMFLPWIMDARSADEGVSVFSGMEGKSVTGPEVTISSTLNGARPGQPFNEEGLPAEDAVWIGNGVLKALPCDRYTARTTGRKPLFIPGTLDMNGGAGSLDDLVAKVDRGILIRRFWYIRFVDQKSLKLTGMTRDGVFLVENGGITGALSDFRWNWRPLDLFRKIEHLGAGVRKTYGTVPPLVIGRERWPFTD
ncbi:MAG TPA: metallopeptidase TldD-related protein [Candidatus Sabulitectum sp.]|nr:metallopeptidase TldD-related protein [Candidatus Sabulitectum sp.]HPJ29187.1 metallopeptidase TldD-related protein [Candidatus Sabulitectum sp.]HPR21626.1 metallopeptidase TldD-related protein [Candidatus Sabulitectum sp.]